MSSAVILGYKIIIQEIIGFLSGFVLNCALQYYAVFELHKKNSEAESSAMFFTAILTAPYVLLIPIIFYVQVQITTNALYPR